MATQSKMMRITEKISNHRRQSRAKANGAVEEIKTFHFKVRALTCLGCSMIATISPPSHHIQLVSVLNGDTELTSVELQQCIKSRGQKKSLVTVTLSNGQVEVRCGKTKVFMYS